MSLQRWIESLRHSFPHRSGTRRRKLQIAVSPSQVSSAAVGADSLEERILLSAAKLTSDEQAALKDATDAINNFGTRLESSGLLVTEIPTTDESVGGLAQIGEVFNGIFGQPIADYLRDEVVTEQGLEEAIRFQLNTLGGVTGNVTLQSDNSVLSFNVDAEYTRLVPISLDLAEHVSSSDLKLDGKLPAELEVSLHFNLTFGIDRNATSASAGAFVEFADNPDVVDGDNPLQNGITVTGVVISSEPVNASIGILGVALEQPSSPFVELQATFDSIHEQVTLADLGSSDLSSIMAIDGDGSFTLNLPVQSDVEGVETTGDDDISLRKDDLFEDADLIVDAAVPSLAGFRTLSVDSLLSTVTQAGEVLSNLGAFDVQIPFTDGQTLDDILNIRDAIQANLAGPVDAAKDAPEDSAAETTGTLQKFAELVGQRVSYDSATNALEFDVSFDHTFELATYELDLGGQLGDLNDFSFSLDTELNVDATLATRMKIGVVLAQPGAAFGLGVDTPLDALFAGQGIAFVDGNDLKITLRDGTTTEVDIIAGMTVGQLIDEMTITEGSGDELVTKLEVSFVEEDTVIGDNTFNTGLKLIDHTLGASNSHLKIEGVNESLAAIALGIAGKGATGIVRQDDGSLDEETHGILSGPLHGLSLADNLYFSPISDEPMFTAVAALTAPIDASAQLGFIDVGIVDGEAVGQLTATFTPTDPAAEATPETVDRITGREILDFATEATLRLKASKPVTFGEAYNGDLEITITESNGQPTIVTLPFEVPQTDAAALSSSERHDQLELLANLMNAKLQELADGGTAGADLLKVGTAGDRLTFTLNDGRARQLAVTGGQADSARSMLGITRDLAGYVARPGLQGSANFTLPYTLNVADLNISGALAPDQTVITIDVPDITTPSFDFAGALTTDVNSLGGQLSRLKNLEFASIIEALQGAVTFLRRLESNSATQFLHEPLPLLKTDLSTILNVADVFGDLIVNLEQNPAQGLGQVEEVLEDLFGLPEGDGTDRPDFAVSIFPELNANLTFDFDDDGTTRSVDLSDISAFDNQWFGGQFEDLNAFLQSDRVQGDHINSVELSLDTDSFENPALRIDLDLQLGAGFGFDVDPLSFADTVSIDLADLGVAGLGDFVDARGEAEIDVKALGQLSLSLGIELPEEALPRPFLYDAAGGGTSLDFLVSAQANDINFDVSVGPLGAKLRNGTLRLDGSEDPDRQDDPEDADDSDNIYSRFSVGLSDNNGDGRHFFDEMGTLVSDTIRGGLDPTDFELSAEGEAEFSGLFDFPGLDLGPLTTAFPALQLPMEFEFAIADVSSALDGISSDEFDAQIGGIDPKELLDDVRDVLAGDFNVLSFVGGWEGAFDLLIDAMEGELFGVELPFIGDKLKDQANFLREIKDSVAGNLSDNADNVENGTHELPFSDVRQDIFDALGARRNKPAERPECRWAAGSTRHRN